MPILASILALLLAVGPALAETAQPSQPSSGVPSGETPARRQASFAADKSLAAAAAADPEAASRTAAAAFHESPGGSSPSGPAVKGFGGGARTSGTVTRGGPQTFAASAVPSVHAAQKGVYNDDDKPPPWDAIGTLKATPFALGGAAIGFLVGGPIGACVGFVIGALVGALMAKAYEAATAKKDQ